MKKHYIGRVIYGFVISSLIFVLTTGVLFGTIYGVSYLRFDRNCSGYLKRAADSSSVETASVELEKALFYLEANNLTVGYTSVIYTTPDEDIAFWFNNLKEAKHVLDLAKSEGPNSMVRSNALMKLRETLLDDSQGSPSITAPSGIWVYPYNALFVYLFILNSLILGCFIVIAYAVDRR